MVDIQKEEWKIPVAVPFPPVTVRVLFNSEKQGRDFDLTGTGVGGIVFLMRLAASATKWNKVHCCGLCTRLFLSKKATSAKWCHDSCKTINSNIKTGKRAWSHEVYFWHKLRAREIKILKQAQAQHAKG